MFEPEKNINSDLSSDYQAESNLDNIDDNVSAKNVAARKKQIESVFIKLIVIGLTFGTVLGVGAYYLLNKLGLTKKPYQLEEKIEQEQQSNSTKKVQELFFMTELPRN